MGTSDSPEHASDGDEQRQQEVSADTSASRGEHRPVLIQELQGHAVGPTEAQLQQEEKQQLRCVASVFTKLKKNSRSFQWKCFQLSLEHENTRGFPFSFVLAKRGKEVRGFPVKHANYFSLIVLLWRPS